MTNLSIQKIDNCTEIIEELRLKREIRVFISSTFRDMGKEREILVKKIFPRIRKICADRGITFSEIDLRWGVHDEAKVLPICLQEINKCRPFFIGLLGERYGWVPEEFPRDILEKEEWLKDYQNRSITELEILHGSLNNPSKSPFSFFYLRSPRYLENIGKVNDEDYCEVPRNEDINKFGFEKANQQAAERRSHLTLLKEMIRKSDFKVREDYIDPEILGELIYEDLMSTIDNIFPKGSNLSPLDQELLDHNAFINTRSKIYIHKQDYFSKIDEHIRSNNSPLVVTGESGTGKSSLLANWITKYIQKFSNNGQPKVIYHFIGASSRSVGWDSMLQRLLGEFKRQFNIEEEIPESPNAIRETFANWLYRISSDQKVVLIIDALNQLEDRDGALELLWLPKRIPENVRLILSTVPGSILETIKRRGWRDLNVTNLSVAERKQLINDYLKELYGKELNSEEKLEKIATSPQTANPLYLRSLLEEIRIYGDHLTLDKEINRYLEAETVDSLYEKILERFEKDYGLELVKQIMSLLWAARRGLSEKELHELLENKDKEVSRASLSEVLFAAESFLINRRGLIGFYHDYFRKAVENKYLQDSNEKKKIHLEIASYFKNQKEISERKVDELPWHLAETNSWLDLYQVLSDLPFFFKAWSMNQYEIRTYWTVVENETQPWKNYNGKVLSPKDAYQNVLENPSEFDSNYIFAISQLLENRYPSQALSIYKYLETIYLNQEDKMKLQQCYKNQAAILQNQGQLDEAMKLLKKQEKLCVEEEYQNGLQYSLGDQTEIYRMRGEIDKALELLLIQEAICKEAGYRNGLQDCLLNQAYILQLKCKFDDALDLLKKQQQICLEIGNRDGYAFSLGLQAEIYMIQQKNLKQALELINRQEEIFGDIGNKNGIQEAFGLKGQWNLINGNISEAFNNFKEQEQICHEINNIIGLQKSYGYLAKIDRIYNKHQNALIKLERKEQICRKLGHKIELQATLSEKAHTLREISEVYEALELFEGQQQICREAGLILGLQGALGGKSRALIDLNRFKDAQEVLKEQEQICLTYDLKYPLQLCYGNQARALRNKGLLQDAMDFLLKQEAICKEIDNKVSLKICCEQQEQLKILIEKFGPVNPNPPRIDKSVNNNIEVLYDGLKKDEIEGILLIGEYGFSRNTELSHHYLSINNYQFDLTIKSQQKEYQNHKNYINNMIKHLTTKHIVRIDKRDDVISKYQAFSLTDIGKSLYKKLTTKEPVLTDREISIEKYGDSIYLSVLKDLKQIFEKDPGISKIEELDGAEADFIVYYRNIEKPLYIKLDTGRQAEEEWFDDLDNMFRHTLHFYFVSVSEQVLYVNSKYQFYKWVKSRFNGFDNAQGKVFAHFTSIEELNKNSQVKWETASIHSLLKVNKKRFKSNTSIGI